jgi:hypothetical protein
MSPETRRSQGAAQGAVGRRPGSARLRHREQEAQGPVDLCIRAEDIKYLVSLLLNLGCEAKRRQAPNGNDAPPTEAIPLPLDAINVGQSDDERSFLLVEVGIASLMFMLSPKYLEQIGQTMLMLSAKVSSPPS